MTGAAKLAYQLGAVQRLFGYSYGRTAGESDALTQQLAAWLASQGVGDIRDIGTGTVNVPIYPGTYVIQGFAHPHEQYFPPNYSGDYSSGDNSVAVDVWHENVLIDKASGVRLEPQGGAVTGYVLNFADRKDILLGTGIQITRLEDVLDAMPVFAVYGLSGGYTVAFSVRVLPDGFIIFIPAFEKTQTTAQAFTQFLSLAFALASFAVPGVGALITNSIFGAANVAAYPALTSIASGAIVNTVLSGGDVKSGVVGALTGAVGGGVGGLVGDATNDLIGTLAASATSAALSGGDIDAAIKGSLLRYGAGSASDFVAGVVESTQPAAPSLADQLTMPPNAAQGATVDDFSNVFSSADFPTSDPLAQFAALDLNLTGDMFGSIANPLQASAYDNLDFTNYADASQLPAIDPSSGTAFQIDPQVANPQAFFSDARAGTGGYDIYATHEVFSDARSSVPPTASSDYGVDSTDYGNADQQPTSSTVQMSDAMPHFSDARYDAAQGNSPTSAPVPGTVPGANSAYTFAQGLRDATSLALSAISVSQAYVRAHRPASIPAGSRVSAGGNAVTAQADGNVTVRTPSGQVSAQRPPVGVPYATADGGAVVNNGDGTYTYASPTGTTVTRHYAPVKTLGGNKALVVGVGVVGALLLMSR